jgi:hypothetical protein
MHSVKKIGQLVGICSVIYYQMFLPLSLGIIRFSAPPPLVSSAHRAESNSAGGGRIESAGGAKSNSAGGA